MDLGLNGKVAMIGGASKGIGFNVARLLAREGVSVSISSRDEAAIQAAKQQIEAEASGAQVLAVAADLSRADAIDNWLEATMGRFGGGDLLFTNTGGPPSGTFNDFGDADWQATFDLLLMSAIRMTRGVYPSMQARGGGAIVMSTSSSVKEPIPNLTLSTVMRASVSALAKSLANEWATDNIRVNQIIPGRILTDRIRSTDQARAEKTGLSLDEIRRQSEATIPLRRIGDPEEYASAAVFLFSQSASYITGATLQVDGGLIRSVT
jgi:3-oxoacyl-[acyl-carrier protein] reductase